MTAGEPAIARQGMVWAPWWTMAAFAVAALPILLVSVPPILDYPNHLTRIWLLAGGAATAPLSAIYGADWSQASTNIGVDLVAMTLAHILPFTAIDKLLQLAMFLGPPLGCTLLNRAVFGRFHPWQIAFPILAWSTTAIAGFLNFQISLGAALIAAVLSRPEAGRPPWHDGARYSASAFLLLLIHPFGLFFYAVLMAGLLVGPHWAWPVPPQRRREIIRGIAILALACAVPLLLLFLFAPVPPGMNASIEKEAAWHLATVLSPGRILKLLASPVLTYDARYDLLLTAPLALVLVWARATGRLRMHAGLLLAATGLLLLAIIAPASIGDATWIQRRIPPMLALTLMAAVRPDFQRRAINRVMSLVLALTLCARVAWIGKIWHDRQIDAAQMFAAARVIPPGASVIVLRQDLPDAVRAPLGRLMAGGPGRAIETQRNMPSLAVIRYRVFIPILFTVPGQQPLRVLGKWKVRSTYVSSIPVPADLNAPQPTDAYLRHWRRDFAYILLINADLATRHPLVTTGLRQVADTHFAKVYHILPSPGAYGALAP